ncbi:MAG: NAD(P)-dependent alcohol dehydrogenase [Burkholderiales bacterium]|nr:NAD(P)-dependent alcohol dehydrogenase [Burkholderiales bacterium]
MTIQVRTYRLEQEGSQYELNAGLRLIPQLESRQVLIRVGATSLNYRDMLVRGGAVGPLKPGLVPLSDAAGTVEAVGSGVTRWKVGDRVAPGFFSLWRSGPFQRKHVSSSLGGGQNDGVLSEKIVADEDAVAAVPDHLTLAEAATLPCAAVAAWQALFVRANLQPGQTVLIPGTGGVALFALQFAAAHGARPIVLSSSDAKLERAFSLGAWQGINYKTTPAWHEEVIRITDGIGANHVLEIGGQTTYDQSLASVAVGGNILQIGVLTGVVLRPNLLPLQFINATIHGLSVGSVEHFASMNAFIAKHRIRPVIDKTFAFEEAPQAYDYFNNAGRFGKVVISVE